MNHSDPLGRMRLHRWLTSRRRGALAPAFVAVEYDRNHFARIVRQRRGFRELVMGEWPFLHDDDYTALELSLGYDGDAHADIFPDAETLWLDNDRSDPGIESDIAAFAEARFENLRQLATSVPRRRQGFLSRLSHTIWNDAKTRRRPTGDERDRRFAELITGRGSNRPWDRALAIVGASHARTEISDSFVSRASTAGIRTLVAILRPKFERG